MSDTRSAFGFDPAERKETIPDLVRQLTEQGSHLARCWIVSIARSPLAPTSSSFVLGQRNRRRSDRRRRQDSSTIVALRARWPALLKILTEWS